MDITSVITAGILTVSDRSFQGIYEDQSGPLLRRILAEQGWLTEVSRIIPDEMDPIKAALLEWCDGQSLNLILTTGGTGLGPRDITPEATHAVIEKEIPGLSELMRFEGRAHTPLASLSRAICGVRKKTLIINLPGSPKGAAESLNAVISLIPHVLAMLNGDGHEKPAHPHELTRVRL